MDHVQKLEKQNNKLRLELEDRQADGDKLRVQSAPSPFLSCDDTGWIIVSGLTTALFLISSPRLGFCPCCVLISDRRLLVLHLCLSAKEFDLLENWWCWAGCAVLCKKDCHKWVQAALLQVRHWCRWPYCDVLGCTEVRCWQFWWSQFWAHFMSGLLYCNVVGMVSASSSWNSTWSVIRGADGIPSV